MEEKFTPRQWALKRFLEDNFVSGKFFSIEEICANVMVNGELAYKLNLDPKKHDKCIALSNDVKTINWSITEGYKIIIKDKKGGVKLCESETEFESWKEEQMRIVTRKFQYLNNLAWKAKRDGIVPIVNLNNRAIDTDSESVEPVKVYAHEM